MKKALQFLQFSLLTVLLVSNAALGDSYQLRELTPQEEQIRDQYAKLWTQILHESWGIDDASSTYLTWVKSDEITPAQCRVQLHGVYKSFASFSLPEFFGKTPKTPSQKDLKRIKDGLRNLFDARIELEEKLRQFTAQQRFKDRQEFLGCAHLYKLTQKVVRDWEDYLGLYYVTQKDLQQEGSESGKDIDVALKPQEPFTYVKADYQEDYQFPEDLQSGDILLSRGNLFTASIIGRIGSVDNLFSHVSLVWVEDGSVMGEKNIGKRYIVESTVAVKKGIPYKGRTIDYDGGLRIISFEEFMDEYKGRLALYRMKHLNPEGKTPAREVAQRAARQLAEMAAPHNILYNYPMDMKDTDTLFCSQAISLVWNQTCQSPDVACDTTADRYQAEGRGSFPLYWTPFNPEKNAFLPILEILVPATFSPADIESDPRVELIAEWKSYDQMKTFRLHDAAISAMFSWAEHEDESLRYQPNVSDSLAYFSLVADKAVKNLDQLPSNTPIGVTKASALIALIVEADGPSGVIGEAIAEKVSNSSNEEIRQYLGTFPSLVISDSEIESLKSEASRIIRWMGSYKGFTRRLKELDQKSRETFGYVVQPRFLERAMEQIRLDACHAYRAKDSLYPYQFHHLFAQAFPNGPSDTDFDRRKACSITNRVRDLNKI